MKDFSKYRNNVEYARVRENKEQYDLWCEENKRIMTKFRKDAEDFFIPNEYSNELKNVIHEKAWEKGHAYGFDEVWNCYYDVMEFVEEILKHIN